MSDASSWSPKEGILIEGLVDWVYAAWVTNYAWDDVPQSLLRTTAIGLIAELLVEGLMIAGDADRNGHHPWACTTGEAIERITRDWMTQWPDEVPDPGDIVWLANTPAGDEIARAALARGADAP